MNKYISIEHAAKAFSFQSINSYTKCMHMLNYAINVGCIECFDDVKQVVHGKWILNESALYGSKQYFCSVCKDDNFWKKRFCYGGENYCPNCGAIMR